MKVPKNLEDRFRDLRLEKERKRNHTPYTGGYREAYIRNDVVNVAPMIATTPTCSTCAYDGKLLITYLGKKFCTQCLKNIILNKNL